MTRKRGQHPPAATMSKPRGTARYLSRGSPGKPKVLGAAPGGQRRHALESELERMGAGLQATIDELARANQNLQISNEELSTVNEELRGLNQELQSREEQLRSLTEQLSEANAELARKNERLAALNAEVYARTEELEQLYGDVQSVALPTLFLDQGLRIQRFTPATTEAFRVGASDVGCAIRDFAARFSSMDLARYAGEVLETLQPRETEMLAGGQHFLVRLRPHRTVKHVIAGVVATFVDVSELYALSRLYAVLSRVNEAIVRTREEQPLYQRVCRIVAEEGRFPLVWIGHVKGREVLPVASGGPAIEYLRQITVQVDGELGSGPTGTAIREDRTVVNQDFDVDPSMAPWRKPAAAFGFRAAAAFPLHRQGKVVGALALYAVRPRVFDVAHVELLEALAADISYALNAIELEMLRAEAERALRASESRLRDAERHKDQFLATLSHELRNPLVPIKNSLLILDRASPAAEPAKRARAVLGRQVQQLTRLVDDLLDVTRIAHGKLRVVRARLDLQELVRRTVTDHQAMFTQAGIQLHLRTGEQPLWVDGDEARIAQAVGNLLANSAKFTASGGQVTIELEPGACDGMAILRVRDTGIGMRPEILTRMFEPFVQAEDTVDHTRGGLGLGLALVKGVVEHHGGCVEGTSDGPGAGSEFVVRLPVAAGPAVDHLPKPSSRPPPRRVLVIEDNQDAAETLRDVLEFGEHEVELAHSGPEGIIKAQQFKPQVVLCDIGLPGMDGYEVARTLRRDRGLGATYLVALTGYARLEDQGLAREAGFDFHLPKPPSLEDIEAVLASLPLP